MMKAFISILTVPFLFIHGLFGQNREYQLLDVQKITPEAEYCAPSWSPDGSKILFTSIGFRGLNIMELANRHLSSLNTLNGAGYNAVWSEDGRSVYYRKKTTDNQSRSTMVVEQIFLDEDRIIQHAEANPNALLSMTAKSEIIVYTNTLTLQIEGKNLTTGEVWAITKDDGQYYHAIPSPDNNKVLVHSSGQMFVYDIHGNGLLTSLGRGIATSWSKDSKQILYFIGTDDGHHTTGSELYLCNADGSAYWQLTNTPNSYEMFPSFSPDNMRIAFSDDLTGAIYIAELRTDKR